MDTSSCPECGAATDASAAFCANCGAAVGRVDRGDAAPDRDRAAAPEQPAADPADRRLLPVLLLVGAVVAALVVAWPSTDGDEGPAGGTGLTTGATLPAELVLRWDVTVPGVGGPVGAGRAPVRLDGGAVAVADVVNDETGAVTGARPPGVLADGRWAAAGTQGLVLGEAARGRVTGVQSWSAAMAVTPTGPALAWPAAAGTDTRDVVLATDDGGAVRLGMDATVRWTADAVPLVGARDVTSGGGPLVPARARGADEVAVVLDLRDGRIVAEVADELRLLAVGHGLAVTADGDDVVAAWPAAAGAAPVVLPRAGGPAWEVAMAPGRPVAVDVLPAEQFAVHGLDSVVGEVLLVEAGDGTVVEVVAGWPNADLDGGRTAEAVGGVVAGVVGNELRRFAWDGTPLGAVPLGSEGWFATRGGDLVQLVSRRTGDVRLVDGAGVVVPTDAPPPAARGDGARLVAGGGTTVGIAGGITSPTALRWVDARTGEVGVPAPTDVPGRVPPAGAPAGALGVVGPVEGDVVVIEPGAVARVDEAGTARWRRDLPAHPALVRHADGAPPGLVVTERHVVVPLADGTVVGVRWDDGTIAWTVPTGVASAVVGAGAEVVVATVTGDLLRLAADGTATVVVDLGAVATDLAVAGDVVVALLPGRLVGIGPPGGPIPDEDRVELSAPFPRGRATPSAPSSASWWHPAASLTSRTTGG